MKKFLKAVAVVALSAGAMVATALVFVTPVIPSCLFILAVVCCVKGISDVTGLNAE